MRNAIAWGLALGAVVLLEQSAAAQLLEKKALSLEAACKMVAAAEAVVAVPTGAVALTGEAAAERGVLLARRYPSRACSP